MTQPQRRSAWKRIEHGHIKPFLRRLKPWRERTFGGIAISYKQHLDGGGSAFGQEIITFLKSVGMPRVARAYEWCAGPGFIGFSILGHGLAETLCLADINPEAVDACRRTVRVNNLGERVGVYHSNNLDDIPASEQWDLIVSNPPHFAFTGTNDLRSDDPDWRIHRRFFETVAKHLKPGGVIVLQENNEGSTDASFRDMIDQSGLTVAFVSGCMPQLTDHHRFYYLGVMRKGDVAPAWVANAAKSNFYT